MKYKKGDEVTITANESGHEFEIGEKVVVTDTFYKDEHPHFCADNGADFWWIYHESDVE